MTSQGSLAHTVSALRTKRMLVLGDLVADEHVVARALSIAREAPVMVMEHVDRRVLPGGATNVAANARALGAEVAVCGVVGDDEAGRALTHELQRLGISTEGVRIDGDRPTTTKTRIWGGGAQQQVQQLVLRLDRVARAPIGEHQRGALSRYVEDNLASVDVLVISDYENGVIHPALLNATLGPALARGVLVAVDAHGGLDRFRGAHVFTPNQPEAELELGRKLSGESELEEGGAELLRQLGARRVLLTRGQEGMSLFTAEGVTSHLPALATNPVDPTGAGDTVAAAFSLALSAGAAPADAARIANAAAAIVVQRIGTAVATADELMEALASNVRSLA